MPYHIKGIGGLRRPKPTMKHWKGYIKKMTLIHNDLLLPPEKPKRLPKPRKPYDMAEARLRNALLEKLRPLRNGGQLKYWRIENSLASYKGLPDFFVASEKFTGFIELKSEIGVISKEQSDFADICVRGNIRHIFARSVDEVMRVII